MALKAKAEREVLSMGPQKTGCRGEGSIQGTLLEGLCRSSGTNLWFQVGLCGGETQLFTCPLADFPALS